MKRLLAAAGVLALLASAGPALAAPAKLGACKAPAGAIVVKAGAAPYEAVVTTPVGALGGSEEEVGKFYLDLAGKPVGSAGKLTLTLSWDDPTGGLVSDYDLVVNGTNDEATTLPEVRTVKAAHCKAVNVAVDVYTGLPTDELTLTAKGA